MWRDLVHGSLWFLGGENGEEAYGMRNDLWMLNMSSEEWTWQAGAAPDQYNGTATYGIKGESARSNTPGARYAGQGWVADRTLYMYGGYGRDSKATDGYLDDLWKFELPCSTAPQH